MTCHSNSIEFNRLVHVKQITVYRLCALKDFFLQIHHLVSSFVFVPGHLILNVKDIGNITGKVLVGP